MHTVIMAVGLSVAIAFALPMICFNNEINRVCKGHDNYKNIYSVCHVDLQSSTIGFGDFLKERIPEVEKASSPMFGINEIMDSKGKTAHSIDKDFFYFFPCTFIEGDESFIDTPGAIAVSAEYAKELAADGPVLGRLIYGTKEIYTVAAVFDDYGRGILRKCDMLTSNSKLKETHSNTIPLADEVMTFISVREGSDMQSVTEKFRKAAVEHWGSFGDRYRDEQHYRLVRYDRITSEAVVFTNSHNPGIRWILGIICALLFLIPLINYINLSIALTTKRAKEMAMRRLNGAGRGSIIMKYCTESLAFTTGCFLFGLVLTKLSVPALNSFIQATNGAGLFISMNWTVTDILLFIALILLTSLICGLAPALIVSRFTPLDVTKGDFRYHSKKRLSKIFICFQSMIAVIVSALSLVMETNYSKTRNIDFHCNVEDVFYFRPDALIKGAAEKMAQELKKKPEVLSVGMTSFYSEMPGIGSSRVYFEEKQIMFSYIHVYCDEDAFNLLEFEIEERYSEDMSSGFWTTDEAEKYLGEFPDAWQSIIDRNMIKHHTPAGRIEDFPSMMEMSSIPDISMLFVAPASEIDFYPGLVIKTIPDHTKARKVIADVYAEVYDEQVTDIMNFSTASKYIEEIHLDNIAPLHTTLKLMRLILVLVIAMTMMGLTGMSIYYASERRHEIAVRKVFGGTTDSETFRNAMTYLKLTLIADLLAIPVIYLLLDVMKQTHYGDRIETSWWVYMVAVGFSLVTSLASVIWQTLRAARSNPAEVLKKE